MTDAPNRVLVVDDDESGRELARMTLEGAGLTVEVAGSAEAAREVIARQAPDLILMDIQLPGIDGLEFTRELKSDPLTASIAVFALTSHQMPIYERAASAAGCVGFISKPISPAVLRAQVETFLDALRNPAE